MSGEIDNSEYLTNTKTIAELIEDARFECQPDKLARALTKALELFKEEMSNRDAIESYYESEFVVMGELE